MTTTDAPATTHVVLVPGFWLGAWAWDAVVPDLVDGLAGDVVLVGHSGGGAVVQMVTDQRPGRIRRVVYVDSGPVLDGVALHTGDPSADLPLPSWPELEAQGNSLDGLDD